MQSIEQGIYLEYPRASLWGLYRRMPTHQLALRNIYRSGSLQVPTSDYIEYVPRDS